MIWIRRTIALPLALIFIILFILLLVVFRINGTLGNPDFYIDQLRQADVYNFIYEEALPAALVEVDIGGDNSEANINISHLKPYIIDLVRQSLPPDWLQRQVENTIYVVLPYVLGDTESFVITIPLKDRVEAAAEVTKHTLHKEDVFTNLYDPAIGFALDEAASGTEKLPPPFALTQDELEPIIRTMLPEEWVLRQLDGAIDEVVPYFTKDKEHFVVRVDISEQLNSLEVIVANILKRPQVYDYFFEDVVTPAVKQNIDENALIPLGVELTDDEVLGALEEVLPPEWYQARVDDTVAQIFSYLRGTQETVEVFIPLADRKPVVASMLSGLVDQRLEKSIDSLPPCTAAELADLMANPPVNSLLQCRPIDLSYLEIKELLGIDISAVMTPLLDMWLPDQLVLSDAELRQVLAGGEDKDMLDQGRELVKNGLSYTDEDLRADLADNRELIENIRQMIAVGFTFSDRELRDWVVNADGENAEEPWQNFDELRSDIRTGRRWMMVLWLIPLLLLVGIGALCGQNWRSRLIWAASVLALASAITYIVFGPLFSALARPRINEAMMLGINQTDSFQSVITNKGVEIAQNAIDSFVGGINTQAIILLAVSVVIIVLASLWYSFIRRRGA